MTPERSAVLLDEELALLAPATVPLPYLDALADDAHDGALDTAGRGLVVRGLAVLDGDLLRAAPGLEELLAPLSADVPQVHAVCPLPGADATLSVLRVLPSGLVHLHDLGEDGVHVLTLLAADEARTRLRSVLDPLERTGSTAPGSTAPGSMAPGSTAPEGDVLALLDRPEAAVRLQRSPDDLLLTVVTTAGGCWCVDTRAAATAGRVEAVHVRPLDAQGLDALLDRLLAQGA